MTLEEDLLKKSDDLLKDIDNEVITVKEYRRRMACVRLNNRMLKILMRRHKKNGLIKEFRKGYILINRVR